MIDIHATEARLRDHLKALTVDIRERSVRVPRNLNKTADYIRDFYYHQVTDTMGMLDYRFMAELDSSW